MALDQTYVTLLEQLTGAGFSEELLESAYQRVGQLVSPETSVPEAIDEVIEELGLSGEPDFLDNVETLSAFLAHGYGTPDEIAADFRNDEAF